MRRAIVFLMSMIFLVTACTNTGVATAPLTAGEVKSFADEFFAGTMRDLNIPGLVFVLVKDGEVLFAEGYGFASLEEAKAVDPNTTLFRIGSVSKLFVALAVLQLVEQGSLEFDQDVNRYLTSLQIQNPYAQPVTLAHLLTHTSGIHDPPYVSNTDASQRLPLGAYLADHLPAVSTPPGDQFAYSNHGYALAAYIVEEVAGIPFSQYVLDNILQPMSMSSSFYMLAPPAVDELAQGYSLKGETFVPEPFDYDHDYPGGAIVSTASDMSRFILAMLQDGCTSGGCVLDAATLAEMQQPRVQTPYENIGQTYGFVEGHLRGVRVLGHTGAIRGFGSSLDLFPDYGVGYFLAFNLECYGTSACGIIPQFRQAFVEHFLTQ